MSKRINAITTTATSAASDDYLPVDGTTNGTRKILATDILKGSAGEVSIAASGTNQNVTLVPSGTGGVGVGIAASIEALLHMQRASSGGTITLFIDNNAATALNNASAIRFAIDSGSSVTNGGAEIKALCTNAGNGATAIVFTSYTGSGNQEQFRLAGDGTATFTGPIVGGVQALSGAGAVNTTQIHTSFTSTGVGNALTLANGTSGQVKTITHTVDGGTGVLTPTTPLGYSTITFTNAGDSVTLRYTSAGWAIIGQYGVTIA